MNKNKQVIISHCKQETFTNPSAPSNISPGPFDSRRCLKFRVGDIYLRSCVSRDICQRGLDVIKSNCFCYFIQNKRFYIERKLTVWNSFHIFMFVDQLLLVDVFSQLYYPTFAKKQPQRRTSVIRRERKTSRYL